MKTLLVVASCPGSPALEQLVIEALRAQAGRLGYAVVADLVPHAPAAPEAIAAAALVFIASDEPVPLARFQAKPVFRTRPAAAIRHTAAVLDSALASLPPEPGTPLPAAPARVTAGPARRLVAITSCPTGIAHTFMAAEALKKGARALGHEILVETQGSVGAQDALTSAALAAADAVIIAADTKVALERFAGKPLHACSTKAAIHDAAAVIRAALASPPFAADAAAAPARAGPGRPARTGAYKHLMTGVSHMLPVVIAGGLALALAFALGGIYSGDHPGTLAAALSQVGGAAFHLMVAILAGYIAYSIADRPGLAAGFVGGLLAQNLGAGFLGGIIAGFLAGHLTRFLATRLRLPASLEALKPILILPLLSTLGVGLLMIYVVGPPVQFVLATLTAWLNAMRGTNALLLGLLLGGMMAFDMGGPVNKAAYTFAVGLLGAQVYGPMAAVMAAGMTPPLGLALASLVAKHRFDTDDRRAAGATAILGLSFITEGAIPYAAKDPLRVIPALVLGSAAAGAISMAAGVQLLVPHGGVFVLLIPGAVAHFGAYAAALATGTLLTTGALLVLQRPRPAAEPAPRLAPA